MSYVAPVKDMLFVMRELAGLAEVQALPGCEDASDETVAAVLEENARFMSEVVAPLNSTGDTQAGDMARRRGDDHAGLQGGVSPRSSRRAGRAFSIRRRIRRPGPAEARRHRVHRDAAVGQPLVRAVPAADRRRDRSAADRRQRCKCAAATFRGWSTAPGPAR
jgi:hypothetical protein